MNRLLETVVIGGADGPTSIFLAGKLGNPLPLFLFVIAAVVVIGGICWMLKKRS